MVSKIRAIDHSTCRVGVWLRGGVTYYYRSREGTIACNITGGTTNCCLSYDNSNNAYDVYVQSTSNVEDCNFGNQGGCNAGNAYLNHHSSLGTSVVLTTGNLQKALCCGCYTNTVCLGNCGVIKNTNFTTGTVCGNDLVRGGHVCGANCVTTSILCSHKCVKVDQGTMRLDGGSCQGGDDATLFVTAYNNNDWGLRVCKNVDSATEYGIKVDMGATATYGYDAVFGGTRKFTVSYNRVCHSGCMLSPVVCGSSYMNSGKFCTGSAFHCNGCSYVNGRVEGCCHISGSSYFCNNCLHVAGGNICSGNAIYLSEWVRFNCSTRGLYWAGACQYHIYPAGGDSGMYFRTCGDSTGIIMTTNNNTTPRGYFYANNGNNIGILDKDGNWAIRHHGDNGTYWSINNSEKMKLTTTCLCHNGVICAASVIKSADWVCGNRICGTHYGDGSNLTGISGGGLCNSCVGDGNLCGFVVIGKCAAGNGCYGGLYSYDNTIAIGQNAMQNYSNTSSNFGDQVAVGQSAMAGSSNTGNCRNAAFGNGAGKYIAASKCYNTAVGTEALGGTSSYRAGSHNTAVGGGSGYFQCGDAGTFIGHCAGGQGAGAKNCGTFVGRCAGYGSTGVNGTYIGHKAGINCSTANMTFIGHCSACVACIYGTVCVSTLSKGSGSFVIAHPDPAKTDDWELKHSFVESPNEGDNIYRWQANVTNCCHVIELPSYYKFLNKNDMAWVSPDRHFGVGYAEVTADQECLVVCTNNDGNYNILLIGTRKDEIAVNNWKAAEIRKI